MKKILLLMGILFLAGGLLQTTLAETASVYKIHRVTPGDALNVRANPGTGNRIITTIPHNGRGVTMTGETKKLGRSTWVQIQWSGKTGWVNQYYLAADTHSSDQQPEDRENQKNPQAQANVVMKCGGTEPFWDMAISEDKMKINILEGPSYEVAVEFRKQSANNTNVAVITGRRGNALTSVFLQKVAQCSDGMSDNNYPYSVTALLNHHKVVSGCCSLSNQ